MVKKIFVVVTMILSLTVMLPSGIIFANEQQPIVNQEGKLQESLDSISSRMDSLNKEFQSLRETETDISIKISSNDALLEEKKAKQAETKEKIDNLIKEIDVLNVEYQKAVRQFKERESFLKRKLVSLQNQHNTNNYIQMILNAESITNLIDRVTAILKFVETDKELLQLTIEEQQKIEAKKYELEGALIQLEAFKMDLKNQMTEIEKDNNEQQNLLKRIQETQNMLLQEKIKLKEQSEKLTIQKENLARELARSTFMTASQNYEKGAPEKYIPYYKEIGEKYGVDWFVLSALHSVESNFGNHPTMISSALAEGHFQFMSCSWVGWSYPGCKGTNGHVDIPDNIKHDPNMIRKYGGYGKDGDSDGISDPFNLLDSLESAASYLAKNGYAKNPAKAIYQYNHANWYVDKVLLEAKKIKELNT